METANTPERKKVIFSAIQPSGTITLGNYVGALRNWVGPVSYTHLDVYKRQALGSSRRAVSRASRFMPSSSMGTPRRRTP